MQRQFLYTFSLFFLLSCIGTTVTQAQPAPVILREKGYLKK
ncbi:hypothetical protein [Chitinophaga defluvii]|uniref:Uncharacterized protein n=1 Tax=Chitinophaga defluvii TaxID=3163343 RepID=A0ABV2TCX8_9BACT